MKVRAGLFHTPAEPRRGGLTSAARSGRTRYTLSGSAGTGSGTRRRSWSPTTRTQGRSWSSCARWATRCRRGSGHRITTPRSTTLRS
eukprot:1830210-Prymnesium_polylepis.1